MSLFSKFIAIMVPRITLSNTLTGLFKDYKMLKEFVYTRIFLTKYISHVRNKVIIPKNFSMPNLPNYKSLP